LANPQPDEFTRISNELYMAIMQTDFSKRQRSILDLIIRMSYGCGKKYALLRPIDFELVGVYKSHITKELNYLQAVKVLFIEDNLVILNKNYDDWRVSLVKTANIDRLKALIKRNLDGYQNSNEVTKTVTNDNKEKVTESVTENQGDIQGEVTKTVTDQDIQPYNGVGCGDPKEILVKDLKEIVVSPPTPPNEKPKSIEDVLTRFPRYSNGQLTIIREYWGAVKFTRQTGKVAASVIAKNMEYWERFPVEVVLKALEIHMRKYQTRQEDYTAGIMRRLTKEVKRDGPGSIKTPTKTGIIDRSQFLFDTG
jgi:hypothetical protein